MSKEQKKQIRNTILKIRNSLTLQEIIEAEKLIVDNLLKLDQFIKSKNVFCYLSFRSEVPTTNIIKYCQQNEKNVYIPICNDDTKEMIISLYDKDVELIASSYGVQEASPETIKISDRNILDTALMPGAVFDIKGYRIGYGAGYYDKFYTHTDKQIYKIALAYSFQIVDEVPKDDFDIPVNCIITEKGIIMCNR
ncbi:MAG: 5-formyltetrahydrofolate cyclo-ligase [Lutisporaceae bacterium]